MKRKIIGWLLLLAVVAAQLYGVDSVTLAWDYDDNAAGIGGFRIYYGPASRTYTNVVDVPGAMSRSGSVTNLGHGVYFFAATAYDTNRVESDFSNEVSYTNAARPAKVKRMRQP